MEEGRDTGHGNNQHCVVLLCFASPHLLTQAIDSDATTSLSVVLFSRGRSERLDALRLGYWLYVSLVPGILPQNADVFNLPQLWLSGLSVHSAINQHRCIIISCRRRSSHTDRPQFQSFCCVVSSFFSGLIR